MPEQNRDERVQRIRIGLTGLAFVFFLVLLGTAISRSSDPAAGSANAAAAGNAAEPEDSLAQIGVAPGQSTSDNEATSDNQANGVAARP